ncbi:hypothetical protein QBC39DRAFT_366769 [Podospora conica]|nr:hypothetical protein QBC39DRAFT_366769 [Schizothecium conicum]
MPSNTSSSGNGASSSSGKGLSKGPAMSTTLVKQGTATQDVAQKLDKISRKSQQALHDYVKHKEANQHVKAREAQVILAHNEIRDLASGGAANVPERAIVINDDNEAIVINDDSEEK